MKAVLMSVKQERWEKILSGEETLEIRKSAPQSRGGRVFRWPLTVLVYVSGAGAVQGEFTCPGWIRTNQLELLAGRSCVTLEGLDAYAKGGSLYGWAIQAPEKYDTPSPLAELGLTRPPVSWQYVEIPDGMEA